ncbi:hydroxyacylglutathione hydrolase [Cereibacter azotoformans]|uniref:Hydroxyacylglutathione hydrolase n=1 Tax=Cereibacter sphaeroides (strain ATCC 17025 / ATH 2.4.3) TaxID=349102 RepID=GLO2_CERS5|nr:hydroxyacylglutathione hydrolase [Cereibacter azotoformans]A4WUN2.1 RecName: Full=Hydroxyacylglutathione hydrolase; AltName: Full=Glyoxalase II; Short=Glx II [Cereibacter sphaeroides ATCC 17025]ULB10306.1 hydroxyacylglutathione hydrolase [Cereibacter azotoformans]
MPLELVTVPCLSDNYAFLVHDAASGETAVVDVPEAGPVMAALAERNWRLTQILLTHHHGDHVAGVAALREATGARVAGAAADAHRLPPLDLALAEGDRVRIGSEDGTVLEVPGHTVGHIAFHFADSGLAFTGDSLMAMGCGRLFEGTPRMMWQSLRKLSALPADTLICSGHEYTQANARFACTLEPENPVLIFRVGSIAAARKEGRPTVPSQLSDEIATNPFLRAGEAALKAAVGMADAEDAEVFAEIRRRKDNF